MTEQDPQEFFKDKSESDTFFGVYSSFDDMPKFDDPYDTEANLESAEFTQYSMATLSEAEFPDPIPYHHIANVFTMLAPTLRGNGQVLDILEYGGRAGFAGVCLMQSAPWAKDGVNYYLLDRSTQIEMLREEDPFGKAGYDNVHYITNQKELPDGFEPDLVLISAALQYEADYKKAISDILVLRPRRILFSHTAVCRSDKSFSTYQVRYVPGPIRRWMFSEKELVDLIAADSKYDLSYRADCYEESFSFPEFPEGYQDCTYVHMLFNRRD